MGQVGGPRKGAGRPRGSKNKRHQVKIPKEQLPTLLPLDYFLALLRDPETEPTRRDEAAHAAAPYCHTRLTASITGNMNVNTKPDGPAIRVISAPAGSTLDPKTGKIMLGRRTVTDDEMTDVESYQPTPALEITDQSRPETLGESLPVLEVDQPNVLRMNPYRRDDDSEAG